MNSTVVARSEWNVNDSTHLNSKWIGAGYDILTMDPYDLTAESKPSVFEQESTNENPSYADRNTGFEDYQKVEMASSIELQESSSVKVTTGLEVPGVMSFTNSNTFTSLQSNNESSHKVIIRVQTSRIKYDGSIVLTDPELRLADGFVKLVSRLPDAFVAQENSDNPYKTLIEVYGTHFIQRVSMGGSAVLQKIVEEQVIASLEKEGVDIDVGLKGTYESVTGSVGVQDTQKHVAKTKNALKIGTESLRYTGGITSLACFDKYVETIDSKPEPLNVDLLPIHMLLDPDLNIFPSTELDRQALVKRRDQLKLAVEHYLLVHGVPTIDWLKNNKLETLYPHYHVYHDDQHTYWDKRHCPVRVFRNPGPNLAAFRPSEKVKFKTSEGEELETFYYPVALSNVAESVHRYQSSDARDDNQRYMTEAQVPGWRSFWAEWDKIKGEREPDQKNDDEHKEAHKKWESIRWGAMRENVNVWGDAGAEFNSLSQVRYQPGIAFPADSHPVDGGVVFRIYTYGGPRRFPRGTTWETPTATLAFGIDGSLKFSNSRGSKTLLQASEGTAIHFEADGNIAIYSAENRKMWEIGVHSDRPLIMFQISDEQVTIWGDPAPDAAGRRIGYIQA